MFSHVGYLSKEVPYNNQRIMDVVLDANLSQLDEVVVVGYGTAKRRDLTGAIHSVDAKVFQNQSSTQLTEMLAGTVAGFNTNQGTTAAGGGSLEVRGRTSLNAATNPVIVIDGVIYKGSLRDINPNDIETIDILKDASSAAVFGARAASGVVIITTAKGRIGKPTINLTTRFGIAEAARDDFAIRGPAGYLDFRRDLFRGMNDRVEPDYHWFNPQDLPDGISIEQWRATVNNPHPDDTQEWLSRLNFFPIEIENFLAGNTLDWRNEVMHRGLRQEGDISISGGSENARYYWSIGYVDNEGLVRGDEFKTLRTRLNVDFKIAEWLNVGANMQYSHRDESVVSASLGNMYLASPYGNMYEADGSVKWFPTDYTLAPNPLLNYYGQDRERRAHNLFASLFAEISLPFGITHRVSFQPRIEALRDYNFWSPETITGGQTYSGGRATREDLSGYEWMVDNLLKWDRRFGAHYFDVTLLHNAEMTKSWQTYGTNQTFLPSPNLGYSGIQFGNNPSISANDWKATGDAMMARLNYSILDKYLFTFSVRRDGYSAFGLENPRATFPAAAFAWQIADESFFKLDFVDALKLRLSWGINGNRDIGGYAALARVSSTQYYDGSNVLNGIYTSTLANTGLRWEETEAINIGLDLGLFKDRIGLTLDYYDMTTRNLLVNRTLPRITGFNKITSNIGKLGNKGFEMTLRTTNINSPHLNWRSNINFSLNRNEIKALFGETGEYILQGENHAGEIPDYTNEWFPGRAIDAVWNYNILGVWQVEEAEDAARYGLFPGDYKVSDLDDNGAYEALQDKMFIGYSEPRFRFGFRNEVDFLSNFSASIFIRADLGHIRTFSFARAESSTFNRRSTANYPYWSPDNRSNDWPRLTLRTAGYGGGIMPYKPASFVRVQDFTLSYQVPVSAIQRMKLQNMRFFGSIRNLYSFDKWPGWDPESAHDPMPRTYTIGVNVSL